jgi:hypothetical protein
MGVALIFQKLFNVTGSNRPSIIQCLMSIMSGYNHEKYWRRRKIVISPEVRVNPLLKLYYLFYIKKVDYKHCCSFGTSYNAGSQFDTPPVFRMDLME